MSLRAPDDATKFPTTPREALSVGRADAPVNPLEMLTDWYDAVVRKGASEPAYVTLATASRTGIPSSRTVQLLAIEPDALLFTTNMGSRKGIEMAETGRAAVSMYWRESAQSVNVTGEVVEAEDAESDERFARETRGVQASRTVSFHGKSLTDEDAMLTDFFTLTRSDKPILRPSVWKWFRVIPDAVTFWEGDAGALNRRLHYARTVDKAWSHERIHA